MESRDVAAAMVAETKREMEVEGRTGGAGE